jgi:uncharacterized RDD family membrane protein YckC
MIDLSESPERPPTLPPLANRAERFAAHILDGVLTMVLCFGAVLGVTLDVPVLNAAFGVLAVAIWIFYLPLSMQLMAGSTPGKRAMGGLWVARADGRPAGFLIGLWRDVVLKVVLSFFVVVDGLFAVARKDRKALHDLGSGTTVRARRAV